VNWVLKYESEPHSKGKLKKNDYGECETDRGHLQKQKLCKGGRLKSSENENVKEDSVRMSSMSIIQSRESVGTRWQSNSEKLATLAVRGSTRLRETLWPSKDQLSISLTICEIETLNRFQFAILSQDFIKTWQTVAEGLTITHKHYPSTLSRNHNDANRIQRAAKLPTTYHRLDLKPEPSRERVRIEQFRPAYFRYNYPNLSRRNHNISSKSQITTKLSPKSEKNVPILRRHRLKCPRSQFRRRTNLPTIEHDITAS
jgi:hypothetical protein